MTADPPTMTDLDAIERRLRRLEANPAYVDDWLEWDDCRTLLKEVRRLQAEIDRLQVPDR